MSFPEALTDRWRGVLIAAAGLVLLVNCWKAPFLTYDDGNHVNENAQVMQPLKLRELFTQPSDYKFFPITILSYRLDRLLFENWMPAALGSWAPGVRVMTLLYHAGAALLVWRLLLLLGVGRSAAFFSGIVFAIHPMGCETVCWASERKTALAGLFGFAALYIYLQYRSRPWRLPVAALLYLLATLSKPSALGLFPVFCLMEWFPLRTADSGMQAPPLRAIAGRVIGLAPFAFISLIITLLNISFHQRAIIPPPGGSIFTALLTDVEILPRYVFNFLVPIRLSFVYFVDPIVSIFEGRLFLYGAALGATVGISLWLAADRRRTLLGWLWFVAALAPTLNLVGISNLMQDRFLYLSIPGLLIVLTETASGLAQKFEGSGKLRPIAIAYIVALAVLSVLRGGIFNDVFSLFKDAVAKQPQAAHARYGYCLGLVKMVNDVNASPGSPAEKGPVLYRLRRAMGDQDRIFMDHCPDANRQLNFTPTALRAAEYCLELAQDEPGKYTADIERYLKLAIEGTPFLKPLPEVRGNALKRLAALKLGQQLPDEAYALAQESVRYYSADPEAKFLRAYAVVLLLQKVPTHPERAAMLLLARTDLDAIPPDTPLYKAAQELKQSPVLTNRAGP